MPRRGVVGQPGLAHSFAAPLHFEAVRGAPKGRDVIAQGNALGTGQGDNALSSLLEP
jgi:hypothetical protein